MENGDIEDIVSVWFLVWFRVLYSNFVSYLGL
jgi:hypothetical protein